MGSEFNIEINRETLRPHAEFIFERKSENLSYKRDPMRDV